MTKSERFSKYTPMLMDKKITQKQYEFILNLGNELPRVEVSTSKTTGDSNTLHADDRGGKAEIQPHGVSSEEEQIATLAQQFGGYVLPEPSEGIGNEDRAQDTLWTGGGTTNHEDKHKGLSQKARLLKLLSDGLWHSTVEIQQRVYGGSHLGVARIGGRVYDLNKEGHKIQSRKKEGTIWEYKKELSETARNLASG